MEIYRDKKLSLMIILSILFGLIGGISGEIITRVYILENAFNIPFFGEINYDRNMNGFSNLIIRDAKKVVVEQDQKVIETTIAVGNSTVGIYKKEAFSELDSIGNDKSEKVGTASLDSASGVGVIVTSDGWLMTNFKPAEQDNISGKKSQNATSTLIETLKKYLIVTKDKKVFSPDKIVIDNLSQIAFWHIPAIDLPVARFSFGTPFSNGQSLMAINWQGWTWLTFALGQTVNKDGRIFSSDKYLKQLIFDQSPKKEFVGSFLYNLGGEIVGLIDNVNYIESIDNYSSIVNSLLKFKTIRRPSLGLNYIDKSDLILASGNGQSKGALIAKDKNGISIIKGSVAEKAGLKEGDIILSVNNIELNADNALGELIGRFLPGDDVGLSYERDNVSKDIKVKLGELK